MNRVSCITVTKNRVHFLKNCIEYFINQTHDDKELVIVYYNTDQETHEYLKEHHDYLMENDVYYYKFIEDEGMHLGAVRNFAISNAKGDWLCIWDDDDYYSPKRIENQLQFCLEKDMSACTLSSIMIFSEKYQEVKISFHRAIGWEGSLFIRKEEMPRYRNLAKGEDTPILYDIFHIGIAETLFDPELYVYRLHDNNTSGSRHIQQLYDTSLTLDANKNREFKILLGLL